MKREREVVRRGAFLALCVLLSAVPAHAAAPAISERDANVEGLKMHYLTAGSGPAVLLLHGYTQTSRMWRPVIPRLADHFTVVAPDLPGIGDSDVPASGLDMNAAPISGPQPLKSPAVKPGPLVGPCI